MTEVAVLAALVVAYAAAARRLSLWSVTPAIVFTAAGALLGPTGLDVLPVSVSAEGTKLLAEATLAVLLFADATTVNPRAAEHDATLIGRLLLLGLPLTIVAGALAGLLVLDGATLAEVALAAAILAPTDAALGMAVFTNRAVPARVRRVLNVESGLNDGIATPVVALLIAVVVSQEATTAGVDWVRDALTEMAVGVGAGGVVGALGAVALVAARRLGWATGTSLEIGILGLAVLAYAGSLAVDGNGFVAAFSGGLTFRAAGGGALREHVGYTETTGQVLAALVWTLFGALLAAPALVDGVAWRPIAYALMSLTVVRMLPVAAALLGAGLRRETVLFMGWFGPRGLASVVFTLLLLIEVEAAGGAVPEDILLAAVWTVLLSVVLHGLTAGPVGRRYGALIARRGPGLRETGGPEPRHRLRVLGQEQA